MGYCRGELVPNLSRTSCMYPINLTCLWDGFSLKGAVDSVST